MDNLHKIEVNFEEIVLVIEDYKSLCTSYLDTKTGRVITLTEDINEDNCFDSEYTAKLPAWERSSVNEARTIFTDESNRYLYLPKINACEEYEFMCDFVDTVEDPNIRLKLLNALNGNGAFLKFRKILDSYPLLEHIWYEFKEKQMRQFIVDFLNGNGYEPVQKVI